MVAAGVMNEALRLAFEERTERVLKVPACMHGASADRCKARVDGPDMICMGGDSECGVHRVSSRMRAEGVCVYMVPHATDFGRSLERWQRKPGAGVAAVACLLNILPGGYEIRRRGIPSQVRSPRSKRLPEALGATKPAHQRQSGEARADRRRGAEERVLRLTAGVDAQPVSGEDEEPALPTRLSGAGQAV